jgi:hypothetical protein
MAAGVSFVRNTHPATLYFYFVWMSSSKREAGKVKQINHACIGSQSRIEKRTTKKQNGPLKPSESARISFLKQKAEEE